MFPLVVADVEAVKQLACLVVPLATMLPARPQYMYRPQLLITLSKSKQQIPTFLHSIHRSSPPTRSIYYSPSPAHKWREASHSSVSLQIADEGCVLQRGRERRDLAPSPPPRQRHCRSSIADDDNPASGQPRLGGCQEVAATATDGDHGHGHQHLPCQGRRPSTSDDDGGGQRHQAHRGVQRQHQVGAGERIQPQAELVSQSIIQGHGRLTGIYKRPLGLTACTSSDDPLL